MEENRSVRERSLFQWFHRWTSAQSLEVNQRLFANTQMDISVRQSVSHLNFVLDCWHLKDWPECHLIQSSWWKDLQMCVWEQHWWRCERRKKERILFSRKSQASTSASFFLSTGKSSHSLFLSLSFFLSFSKLSERTFKLPPSYPSLSSLCSRARAVGSSFFLFLFSFLFFFASLSPPTNAVDGKSY